jgi:hypothetical protein
MRKGSALDSAGKNPAPGVMNVEPVQPKTVEKTTTVKCCLMKSMTRAKGRKIEKGRFLTEEQFKKFRGDLEKIVGVISRMQRRASLAMLYHVTKSLATGRPPFSMDVRKANLDSTWWKNWLRLGAEVQVKDKREMLVPDEQVRGSYADIVDTLGPVPVLPGGVNACFDQVIGFAAISFQTSFVNNMWVPLIPRLERLVAALIKEAAGAGLEELDCEDAEPATEDESKVTRYRMMSAIRSGTVPAAWPVEMRKMARDIRKRLVKGAVRARLEELQEKGVRPIDPSVDTEILVGGYGEVPEEWPEQLKLMASEPLYIWDDFGKITCDCGDLVQFNWWMQTEFSRLGIRQMRLCPVMGVTRQHVRLDRKVLMSMLLRYIPEDDEQIAELKELSKDLPTALEDPRLSLPAVPPKGRKETPEQTRVRGAARQARDAAQGAKAFKEKLKKYNASVSSTRNPDKDLPALPTKPTKKPKLGVSQAEHALLQEKYEAAVVVQTAAKAAMLDRKQAHDRRKALEAKIIGSFFHLPKHAITGKGDWQPSIATDGICVSFNFVKKVPAPKPPSKRKAAPAPMVSPDDKAFADALDSTVADVPGRKVAVLSLDPGRVALATVVLRCNGKTFVRRLSRARYLNDSGITSAGKTRSKTWACMGEAWAKLQDGGALRTTQPAHIIGYLKEYQPNAERWWQMSMHTAEARIRFSAYIGKQRTLDRFFGDLKTAAREFLIECLGEVEGRAAILEVAYGSAGPCMRPGGRGELSVPTTGSFKACCRAFKGGMERVALVDEHRTTAFGWNGMKKEKAYKKVSLANDGRLVETTHHTAARYIPVVREADLEVFNRWREMRASKLSLRRGGTGLPKKPFWPVEGGPKKEKKQRYPECRGLRFCPETRMFFDRDLCSAMSIGKLRVLELLNKARPTHFCRNTNGRGQTEDATKVAEVGGPATGNPIHNNTEFN